MDIDTALVTRNRVRKGNVERMWTPKQIRDAFIETFELIGGVPRLALWANEEENYETFLKLLITLAPKGAAGMMDEMKGQILEYRSNVPQSPLNRGVEILPPEVETIGYDQSPDES